MGPKIVSNLRIIQGSQDPEGNVPGFPGEIFQRNIDQATGTVYIKKTGVGKTGWEEVGASAVQSVVAGTNVTVDNTDPFNPIVSASSASLLYLSYVALLTQNGSNAPGESYVYNNDLSGSISWSRSQAGLYIGTLAGAFPDGSKCAIILGAPSSQNSLLNSVWQSTDTVAIYTINNTTGVQADDLMNSQLIEIRVYP